MRRRCLAALLVVCATGLAACGDDRSDDAVALTETTVVPTPPATTPAVTTATQTTPPGEQDQGDETASRVPAAFTVENAGRTITPAVITVPAYFAVELSVTASGGATNASIEGPQLPRASLTVSDGATQSIRIGPLEPGRYTLRTDAAGLATIRAVPGGDVGP